MPLAPHPVRPTAELARIRALPRRTLTAAAREAAARRWTERLALRPGVALRPWQGAVLDDAVRTKNACRLAGGVVAWLPVGQGKTLLCETLPVVLEAERSVLIAPASLRQKTFADRAAFRGVWRTASPPPLFISKEELALEQNALKLEQVFAGCKSVLVLIDESDELANPDVGAPKRITRAVRKLRAAGVRVMVGVLTGTSTRRSILNHAHHFEWVFGPEAMPVPSGKAELLSWAAALDDAAPRQGYRPRPGALGETLEQARAWYLDRLRSTPGVVICDEDSAEGVPLTLRVELAPEDKAISAAFDRLLTAWESPSGEAISDPLSMFRIGGQLGCGHHSYWDPPPPKRWVEARKAFAKLVRDKIASSAHSSRPLDTEAQVARAYADHPAVVEWRQVRDPQTCGFVFDPLKAAKNRWISDATVDWAVEWLDGGPCPSPHRRGKHEVYLSNGVRKCRACGTQFEPSVVWCGSVPFAERLAKRAKLAHYGAQGRDKNSGSELHAARTSDSMVCSWHACRRGFNLQAWRRHCIILPPQSAKALEQIFGRSHRQGQTKPVHFTILATSGGTLDSFAAAFSEAEFARDTAGSTQKILRATLEDLPTPPARALRWATRE